MPLDYNETLNLPKTDFPMKGNLARREPSMLEDFLSRDIYGGLMRKNEGKPLFILHDGPPFPNGDIHIGTALNKTLKDFIVRYKNMSGFRAPYVPGWDTHGLPIESAIIKKNKLDRKKMSVPEFRAACQAFAEEFVDRQRKQFLRLGIIGDWAEPYLTMDPKFEAEEVRVFGTMYDKGYIYKGLKPVYWCPSDETALAEAEIEYADVPCDAIFVKFKVSGGQPRLTRGAPAAEGGASGGFGTAALPENTYFVIWTTTAWTLPGNLAISLNPDVSYALVCAGGETLIIAESLVPKVMAAAGIEGYSITETRRGADFELMTAKHPLYERESLIINGNHVTVETGTGCVHTAPGFGVDDFSVCAKYPQIGIVVPVDSRGIMTVEAGQFAGLHYEKANAAIIEDLRGSGALFAAERIMHSYPHCWRCKKPIIFRATEQWFASVKAIKEEAVAACDEIKWIPEWGRDRMVAMIRERNDWCISRQRHWGLPIPVFYCDDCGKPVCTPETTEIVASLFAEKGSNAWYDPETGDILPEGFKCPHCAGTGGFTKETDTLDGWFDSGSTHAAVLEHFEGLRSPADVYLEGSDQYRGWFQSSMLTSIATRGRAPYRRIITHGWTVDGEGKAMHKSQGNAVAPDDIINKYGADLLRLWVASTDYRTDVRISENILKQLSDIYLKIRNTARYILGNLHGFDLNDMLPYGEMDELDRWALSRANDLIKRVRDAYERYEYHTIFHGVHNFCAVDMSNFYFDVIKDRLYCDPLDSVSGRSARTAIYKILDALVRLLAPILAFTSEEIWAAMPHEDGGAPFALYADMPEYSTEWELSAEDAAKWERLLGLRDAVNKAMEIERAKKTIGKSLEAEVTLYTSEWAAALPGGYGEALKMPLERLAQLFIVSKAEVIYGNPPGCALGDEIGGSGGNLFAVEVRASEAEKCPRCWTRGDSVHADGLCLRCADVVSA